MLHPVFRTGSGLGKNTGRTWLKLRELDRPTTVKELVETGHSERRTIDRHLKKLEEHGLAVKSGAKWTASGDDRRLDELAVELGAAERAASQAERYERGREGFRVAMQLKQTRRGNATPVAVAQEQDSTDLTDGQIERLIEEHDRHRQEEELAMHEQVGH